MAHLLTPTLPPNPAVDCCDRDLHLRPQSQSIRTRSHLENYSTFGMFGDVLTSLSCDVRVDADRGSP